MRSRLPDSAVRCTHRQCSIDRCVRTRQTRLDIALWAALLLGIIANAAMAGLYAVGPPLYPTAIRTTGMGWAIGIGRFGAILAPLASGALLDRGWLPAQLYFFFGAPIVVAALALFLIGPARASATA
jgi:hypothetical protein